MILRKRNSEPRSIQLLKEEDGTAGYSAVNGGDSLIKKSCRKSRKRKDSVKGDKSVANKAESSVEACDVFQDDEENLEENAARMLSSRFNPCCTGFSSNNKVSVSPSENGLSFLISSGQSASPGSKNLSGSESASIYASLLKVDIICPYPLTLIQSPFPYWYDLKAHCDYHDRIVGYSIENCLAFKRVVQNLINVERLKSNSPVTSNHPIPNHGDKGVNAIHEEESKGRCF
ncbi:uncharacterized protein LOC120197361 [Hibiscus syriacus]|uniref:uncharacterized protein LOC120197361 n=1 Tax=Hibiscus syriacus TaxID=106335 RepID=UPI001921E1E8|nr:uncharacterized protein LOC120197361 [Hibiscus syriacus]